MGSGVYRLDVVLDAAVELFGVSAEELVGSSRRHPLASQRNVTMAAVRELTEASWSTIASLFGGRDHTTVIAACQRVERVEELRACRGLLVERARRAPGPEPVSVLAEVDQLRAEVAELRSMVERLVAPR